MTTPLLPGGTARARFGRPADDGYPAELLPALSARDVDEGWLALAHELARRAPGLEAVDRRALVLWVLAVYGAMEQGSTLLPARDVAETLRGLGVPADDAGRAEALAREVDRGEATPRVAALHHVVGPPDASTPLVQAPLGVYARAAWQREVRVAEHLAAARSLVSVDAAALAAAVDDVVARPSLSGGRATRLNTAQLAAVRAAAEQRLAVVSGGPGTGKTSTVVAVLRVLARLGVAPASIALAAPTGKAMHRLQTSVATALAAVVEPGPADLSLRASPPVAQTLHRLLGWQPHRHDFAWSRLHRMPHRVVIVDEGSMIDLALMDRLLEALADDARLLILGDADQLPSVEVGAVFRDLVAAGGDRAVRLTESYRMRVDDPAGGQVYQAAQAVNAGDTAALFAHVSTLSGPEELSRPGVGLYEVSERGKLASTIESWTERQLLKMPDGRVFLDEARRLFVVRGGELRPQYVESLRALLAHVEATRILCVTRSDARPTGVAAVNQVVRQQVRRLEVKRAEQERQSLDARYVPPISKHTVWAPGDPVLVERNDYGRDLWNGDFGLVVRTAEPSLELVDSQLMVVFQPEPGRFVFQPVAALRGDITHAWAMTVHKAQGSELDRALFVLPWDPIPLMTREIVYTAVSRARKVVGIVGPRSVLEHGVTRRLLRRSGLAGERAAPE